MQARNCAPLYDDLVFRDTLDGFQVKRSLETALVFRDADFSYLNMVRAQDGYCAKLDIEVMQNGVLRFYGVLALNAGQWSDRDATLSCKVQEIDEYSCIDRNKKRKINILDLPKVPRVRLLVGRISDPVTCVNVFPGEYLSFFRPTNCLPDGVGWTAVFEKHLITVDNENPDGVETEVIVDYRREEYEGENPPGAGWTEVGTNLFARPLYTVIDREINRNTTGNTDGGYQVGFDRFYRIVGDGDADLPDNGVLLTTILDALVEPCSLSVRSNFLGINPDGTAPANTAYNTAESYQNIVIFQKSDAKRPNAIEEATIGEISLEDVFSLLAGLNLQWWIKNGFLRIEHISYPLLDGLDISNSQEIVGATDYTYDRNEIPRRQVFTWMDVNTHPDFDGQPIEYDEYCSEDKEDQIAVQRFSTNLVDMQNRQDRYDDQGFCPLATFLYGGQPHIILDFGINSGDVILNQPLAWSAIQENLYKDEMPLPQAEMNGRVVVFDSTRPTRQQQEINLSLPYSLYFAIDFSKRIKSQFGWGKISQAEYSAKNCRLKIELIHE